MLGVCQWFHYEDHATLERTVESLDELGCRRLRTGISWADFHRPHGRRWYRRQMATLAAADVDALVSVWHTPPSIAEGRGCSSPPARLETYAEFIGEIVDLYGDTFDAIEIWNEPNNRIKWNFRDYDPDWSKFSRLARLGSEQAKRCGKTTVLGGMIPIDPSWLRLVDEQGGLEFIDCVGVHAFPGMWWPNHPNWDWYHQWRGWEEKVEKLAPVADDRPIWATETGLATWELDEGEPGRFDLQARRLREAAQAPVERLYWYSLIDLDPRRPCIEMTEDGGRCDANEYHMGLVSSRGERKPAFYEMQRLLAEEAAEA